MVFDFNAFQIKFGEACIDGIRLLARQYNASPFYAVSVYVDGFDGQFGLYANTEDEFSRTLEKYRAEYPEVYVQAACVKALKYNCGDWQYQSLCHPNDFASCVQTKLQAWSAQVYDLSYNQRVLTEEHHQLFEEVACRIALSTAFTHEIISLNRTNDFLVTVSVHDEPSIASIYRRMWYKDKGCLDGFNPYIYSEYS